jgi:hypothetical protein
MKKHEFILKIESDNKKFFSEIRLGKLLFDESQMKKLERIYFEIDYRTGFFEYIIYKGPTPFYLSLDQVDGLTYEVTCYCDTENYDKVRFFLNTLIKKQKNANDNLTGTQIQN